MTTTTKLGFEEVRQAAYGRWESIHRALGIHLQTTSHRKHTPCLGCGGRDRFRVQASYAEYGNWFCSGGGNQQSGDGFALLCHVYGYSLADALKAVKEHLGLDSQLTDYDRAQLRRKAEQQAATYARMVQAKEEQKRLFSNIRGACDDLRQAMDVLEDEIQSHEFKQRQINDVIPFIDLPLMDSLLVANHALSRSNAELYQHAQLAKEGMQ